MPAESSIVFYNGSNYDGCFIIKKLAEDLKEQFLWKHTKKYITFSVLIEKVVIKIDKKRKRKYKNLHKKLQKFYRLQFMNRAIFMASSLSIL